MLALAATAARIASTPECEYVPSPMFWNTCCVPSVKLPTPTHGEPSCPIGTNCMVLRSITTAARPWQRSEEHTSELQSLMRISYAVFCLKKKNKQSKQTNDDTKTYL